MTKVFRTSIYIEIEAPDEATAAEIVDQWIAQRADEIVFTAYDDVEGFVAEEGEE